MSNKYDLLITPEATADLSSIYEYISNELDNVEAAEKIVDTIEHCLFGLEDMPYKHAKLDFPELPREYRKCVVEKYIVIYTVEETNKKVIAARVFYGRRDYLRILE